MGVSKRKQKITDRTELWFAGTEHRCLHGIARPKYSFLYHIAQPECETALHGNSSIRVRESKKEYGMSLIGISER